MVRLYPLGSSLEPSERHTLIQGGQGLGIALVAAQRAQVPVTLVDSSQASIDKGLKFAGLRPMLDRANRTF